jgi:hypothetical protein
LLKTGLVNYDWLLLVFIKHWSQLQYQFYNWTLIYNSEIDHMGFKHRLSQREDKDLFEMPALLNVSPCLGSKYILSDLVTKTRFVCLDSNVLLLQAILKTSFTSIHPSIHPSTHETQFYCFKNCDVTNLMNFYKFQKISIISTSINSKQLYWPYKP